MKSVICEVDKVVKTAGSKSDSDRKRAPRVTDAQDGRDRGMHDSSDLDLAAVTGLERKAQPMDAEVQAVLNAAYVFPVPEPATWGMLLPSMAFGLFAAIRKDRTTRL